MCTGAGPHPVAVDVLPVGGQLAIHASIPPEEEEEAPPLGPQRRHRGGFDGEPHNRRNDQIAVGAVAGLRLTVRARTAALRPPATSASHTCEG
eukprot:9493347-Pyramimonas_sp.AAC.1